MSLKIMALNARRGLGLFLMPALLLLTSASVLRAEDMPSAQARIVISEGDVTVNTAGGSMSGKKGALLDQGAEIMVGEDSSTLVTLGEGRKSSIKLDGGSKAALTSLDPVKVSLQSGKLVALVNGLAEGSTFQVMTPTATATARGTLFSVTDSVIAVLSGTVMVEAGGETTEVKAGQEMDVQSKSVSDISADNAADIEDANAAASAEAGAGTAEPATGDRQNIQVPVTP